MNWKPSLKAWRASFWPNTCLEDTKLTRSLMFKIATWQQNVWWIHFWTRFRTAIVCFSTPSKWRILDRECEKAIRCWQESSSVRHSFFHLLHFRCLLRQEYSEHRILIGILQSSQDSTILSVATNDLSQFLKFCDSGKKWVWCPEVTSDVYIVLTKFSTNLQGRRRLRG